MYQKCITEKPIRIFLYKKTTSKTKIFNSERKIFNSELKKSFSAKILLKYRIIIGYCAVTYFAM